MTSSLPFVVRRGVHHAVESSSYLLSVLSTGSRRLIVSSSSSDGSSRFFTPFAEYQSASPLEPFRWPSPPVATSAPSFVKKTAATTSEGRHQSASGEEDHKAKAAGLGEQRPLNNAAGEGEPLVGPAEAPHSPTDMETTARLVKNRGKRVAMKLSALLAHHRDSSHVTLPVASSSTPYRGNPSQLMNRSDIPTTFRSDLHPLAGTTSAAMSAPSIRRPLSAARARAQAAIEKAAAQQQEKKLKERKEEEESAERQQQQAESVLEAKVKKAGKLKDPKTKAEEPTAAAGPGRNFHKTYAEERILGWSPSQLYTVVADVRQYNTFLPWCLDSVVHAEVPARDRRTEGDGVRMTVPSEMTATLTVGFSFLKEEYTSLVTLQPPHHIVALLYDQRVAEEKNLLKKPGAAAAPSSAPVAAGGGLLASFLPQAVVSRLPASPLRGSGKGQVLRQLHCDWVLREVPEKPQCVRVVFNVAFEFRNPLYASLIMSNIVSLMTRSFEKRCEALYGPPSQPPEEVKK